MPPNAGILAIRAYTPAHCVRAPPCSSLFPSLQSANSGQRWVAPDAAAGSQKIRQESLEEHDNVKGKYTKGMGMAALSCCCCDEDSVSMAMTVVASLLEEYQIDPAEVGKLYAASEGHTDTCKSISSHLRSLFPGNDTIEGVDLVHACYAMSSGLLASLDYIESPHWDGRFALVVGSDIAVYPPGPAHQSARATGGCGAVAILIGQDAPLVVDRTTMSVFSKDSHEFMRPISNWPFPVFDGQETNKMFRLALTKCWARLWSKAEKRFGESCWKGLDSINFFVSHAPYPRLIQKSYAQLGLLELMWKSQKGELPPSELHQKIIQQMPAGGGSDDDSGAQLPKQVEQGCMQLFESQILCKVMPGLNFARQCGNCYTAALYGSLASLLEHHGAQLEGKRCLLFAFGSGAMASMFLIEGRSLPGTHRFNLATLSEKVGLSRMLESRREVGIDEFLGMLSDHQVPFAKASHKHGNLRAGTYRMDCLDGLHKRSYTRTGG